MKKTSVLDTHKKQLPEKEIKTVAKPLSFMGFFKEIELISVRELLHRLGNINFYRVIREWFIRFYLGSIVTTDKKKLTITWQPILLIVIKVALVVIIALLVFPYHLVLGEWLEQGFAFFRLHEIYNFDFPQRDFFINIAKVLFLFVIGYYSIFFGKNQIQALFSSLSLSKNDKTAYYVRNFLIQKDVFIFNIPEMDFIILKQNIIFRIFGIGTISFQRKSGEQIVIKSLKNATKITRLITKIKNKKSQDN